MKRTIISALMGIAISSTVPGAAPGADATAAVARTSQSWIKLTFKNEEAAEDLREFPVLVRLDPSRINYADAGPGGANLRFMDSDGVTELPREIETWNPVGASIIWVKVPVIDRASAADYIYMLLDASGETTLDPKLVWNDSYLGVWHFNGFDDSSQHLHRGMNHGSVPAEGFIGPGLDFPLNEARYVEVVDSNAPTHPLNLRPGTRYTFSCWVWSEEDKATNHYGILLGKARQKIQYHFFLKPRGLPPRAGFEWHGGGSEWKEEISMSELRTRYRTWDYMLVDLAEDWMPDRIYVNGVKSDLRVRRRKTDRSFKEEKEYLTGYKDRPILENNFFEDMNVMIGARKCGGGGRPCVGFDGRIDEMRLIGGVRLSDSWIQADYKSQTDSFIVYGEPMAYRPSESRADQ